MPKGGRPTDYREEYCELATNYALLGATDVEMAGFFGVNQQTLNRWKKAHPEFCQSLKEGKEVADAKVVKSLFHRATGYAHEDTKFATFEGKITDRETYEKHYPPDTTAAIFWLKNRQRDKWSDKTEVSHTIGGIGDLIEEVQDQSARDA